ncbi:MAG: hypothetical protein ACXWG1_11775 [Usitatibacter sp.]
MAILVAIVSSLVTGMLVAIVSYALGVERRDLLVALGFIGACTHLAGVVLWYLLALKARA